jgi:predicted GTPase
VRLARDEKYRENEEYPSYRYVWIDTCCMDKTNNVELSEAINSMFRWYLDASICYVYLSDVSQGMIGDVDNQVRASD